MTAQESPQYMLLNSQLKAAIQKMADLEAEYARRTSANIEFNQLPYSRGYLELSLSGWKQELDEIKRRKRPKQSDIDLATQRISLWTDEINKNEARITALIDLIAQQAQSIAFRQAGLEEYVITYNEKLAEGQSDKDAAAAAAASAQNTQTDLGLEEETDLIWYKKPQTWIIVGAVLVALVLLLVWQRKK